MSLFLLSHTFFFRLKDQNARTIQMVLLSLVADSSFASCSHVEEERESNEKEKQNPEQVLVWGWMAAGTSFEWFRVCVWQMLPFVKRIIGCINIWTLYEFLMRPIYNCKWQTLGRLMRCQGVGEFLRLILIGILQVCQFSLKWELIQSKAPVDPEKG